MESIQNYMEPRDIYNKIGANTSELSEVEHGFICRMIKKYKPKNSRAGCFWWWNKCACS